MRSDEDGVLKMGLIERRGFEVNGAEINTSKLRMRQICTLQIEGTVLRRFAPRIPEGDLILLIAFEEADQTIFIQLIEVFGLANVVGCACASWHQVNSGVKYITDLVVSFEHVG